MFIGGSSTMNGYRISMPSAARTQEIKDLLKTRANRPWLQYIGLCEACAIAQRTACFSKWVCLVIQSLGVRFQLSGLGQ